MTKRNRFLMVVVLAIVAVTILSGCERATPPCGSPVYCALCDGWGEHCACFTNPSQFAFQLLEAMTWDSPGQVSYWMCE